MPNTLIKALRDDNELKYLIQLNAVNRQRILQFVKRLYKQFHLQQRELLLRYTRKKIAAKKYAKVSDLNFKILRQLYNCFFDNKKPHKSKFDEIKTQEEIDELSLQN